MSECSSSMLTCPPSESQRIANSHLRKVSVSESNVLLDEEVLTDPKIQMLLLTVLVRNSGQVHVLSVLNLFCLRTSLSSANMIRLTKGFKTFWSLGPPLKFHRILLSTFLTTIQLFKSS